MAKEIHRNNANPIKILRAMNIPPYDNLLVIALLLSL
jgi:hypothetical protein